MLPGQTRCAPFQRGGGHGAYGLRSGPDELSALIRPNPPLPQ